MSKETIARRDFVKIGVAAGTLLAGGGLLSACASNESAAPAASNGTAQSQQSEPEPATPAQTQPETAPTQSGDLGKVLVAYYSAQGHTRAVAETLADELGADLFEIVPTQPYSEGDLDWTNSSSRVAREHDDATQRDTPLAQAAPAAFADYNTVLLGYPIWWGEAAWPTNHFATDNDFAGKRVITFCTSASSDLGSSTDLLAQAAGTGAWEDGQRFSSSASESEVRTWARSL